MFSLDSVRLYCEPAFSHIRWLALIVLSQSNAINTSIPYMSSVTFNSSKETLVFILEIYQDQGYPIRHTVYPYLIRHQLHQRHQPHQPHQVAQLIFSAPRAGLLYLHAALHQTPLFMLCTL